MNKLSILILGILVLVAFKTVKGTYKANVNKQNCIATLTIFSYDGKSECKYGINAYGHSFLSLENNSDETLDLYGYQLKSGKNVFFSWWAIDKHMGIWFNLESNYILRYNRYETRYSVSTNLDSDDIDSLNTFLQQNDRYSPLDNCSKMTLKCWNSVAEENKKIKVKFITTPNYVVKQIKQFQDSEYVQEIVSAGEIGYMNEHKFIRFRMN